MITGIILDDFYGPFQPKPLKVKKITKHHMDQVCKLLQEKIFTVYQ